MYLSDQDGVDCEDEPDGGDEVVLVDPQFILVPDQGGIQVCKST